MSKVAADLLVCRKKFFLIVTDYTSKYFELAQPSNASSDTAVPTWEVYLHNMAHPK